MVHLDTNFLIDALVPGSAQEEQMVGWLGAGETLGISAIAWDEFLCGPLSPSAEALARRSKSNADCCIAAVAIRLQVPLATGNHDDFTPMVPHGLVLA